GAQRPTCANCIKSKRHCEGYNQRVIFKDPLSIIRNPSSTAAANHSYRGGPSKGRTSTLQYSQFSNVLLPQQTQHTSHPTISPTGPSNSQNNTVPDDGKPYSLSGGDPSPGKDLKPQILAEDNAVPSIGI